jgi:hypothetical protein
MVQAHQPDESVFRSILPEQIDWKPFPAFPPIWIPAMIRGTRALKS